MEIIRTFTHSSKFTNNNKIKKLDELFIQYKQYVNFCCNKIVCDLYRIRTVPKYIPRYKFSLLSERYKTVAGRQALSFIRSSISNIKSDITRIIQKSSLSDVDKKTLHIINEKEKWFNDYTNIRCGSLKITKEHVKIIRKIFKQCMFNIPKQKQTHMILNCDVVRIEKTKTSEFDYWVILATLDKYSRIKIPIKSYNYFQNYQGVLKQVLQIWKDDGVYKFGLMKSVIPIKTTNTNVIGIDVGYSKLLTTSSGNNYGLNILQRLHSKCETLNKKIKNCNQQNLKFTKSIMRMRQKIKNFVKNEIGRCLNRMLKKEQPCTIVIENLSGLYYSVKFDTVGVKDFLNLRHIETKLREKCECLGIELVVVNAAYTSQECPLCSFTSINNRKTQKEFECGKCGFSRNADFVGSVNILNRRSDKDINIHMSPMKIKEILDMRFLSTNAFCNRADT